MFCSRLLRVRAHCMYPPVDGESRPIYRILRWIGMSRPIYAVPLMGSLPIYRDPHTLGNLPIYRESPCGRRPYMERLLLYARSQHIRENVPMHWATSHTLESPHIC